MNKFITLSAVAASALALAACSNSDDVEATDAATADAAATAEAEATPAMTMPDPIAETKTYRCRDNSVVTVDFLSRGDLTESMTANIRTEDEAGTSTGLTRADADSRYEAEGYSVSGNGDSVTIEVPGKNAQLCKA